MAKCDMRIIKTKKALRNAIHELLKTTTFEKLTVSQICKKAEINRVTFYSHYVDKYELLQDYLENLYENILLKTKAAVINYQDPIEKIIQFGKKLAQNIIDICVERKEVISSFGNQENSILVSMIDKIASEQLQAILNESKKIIHLKNDPSLLIPFIVGGTCRVIYDWIENNQGKSTLQFKQNVDQFLTSLLTNNIL